VCVCVMLDSFLHMAILSKESYWWLWCWFFF